MEWDDKQERYLPVTPTPEQAAEIERIWAETLATLGGDRG